MQKNTRLESSRRTVPPKRRLRLPQVLGKRRQDSHCTQGPLKSGKQTALPTFQQPPLLECYKSSNQFLLHLEFVPAHPSFVWERGVMSFLSETSLDHSVLSACMGSIFDARMAGNAQATSAVTKRPPTIVIRTTGSSGLVPYRMERMNEAAVEPPTKPISNPRKTGRKPSNNTRRSTSDLCAPSAMRMPISVFRWATRYESTPYSPIAANNRESVAKASTSVALKLWVAVDLPRICCMVKMSETGSAGSSAATCC